jgi:hypothetical protein
MKIFVIELEFVFWLQDAEKLRAPFLGMLQDNWGLNITESYTYVVKIIAVLFFCKGLIN